MIGTIAWEVGLNASAHNKGNITAARMADFIFPVGKKG